MNWLTELFDKFKGVLLSRKFWAALGATIVLLTSQAGVTEVVALEIAALWIAFILGTAWEDAARNK